MFILIVLEGTDPLTDVGSRVHLWERKASGIMMPWVGERTGKGAGFRRS